jgi:hypothetical protein
VVRWRCGGLSVPFSREPFKVVTCQGRAESLLGAQDKKSLIQKKKDLENVDLPQHKSLSCRRLHVSIIRMSFQGSEIGSFTPRARTSPLIQIPGMRLSSPA